MRDRITNYAIPSMEKLKRFQSRQGIGFETLFSLIDSIADPNTYPPHNLQYETVENEDNCNGYIIQLPVVGRDKEYVDIQLNQNTLIVKVEALKLIDDDTQTIHSGLALRGYEKSFTIKENIEVVDASVECGLLEIRLKEKKKEETVTKIEIK